MGPVRMAVRLPLLILHFLLGTLPTVLSFYPPFRKVTVGGKPLRDVMLRWWSGTVCRIFGVHVRARGVFADGAVLIVANHISWLDPQVLHSLSPMGFVAKSEIGRWPVAGYLARVGETVFHERGSHDSASGVVTAVSERLSAGGKVAIFPEGGILRGHGVKRFHARLFAAAIDTDTPVQPVSIRYLRDGAHYEDITFLEGESFLTNIFRLLAQAPVIAEVEVMPPISSHGLARRELALLAENSVRHAFNAGFGDE